MYRNYTSLNTRNFQKLHAHINLIPTYDLLILLELVTKSIMKLIRNMLFHCAFIFRDSLPDAP